MPSLPMPKGMGFFRSPNSLRPERFEVFTGPDATYHWMRCWEVSWERLEKALVFAFQKEASALRAARGDYR